MRQRWLISLTALTVALAPALAGPSASAATRPAAARSGGDLSGYVATGGTYTSVSASWVQPTATCTSSGNTSASFWVGLDGYDDSTGESVSTTVNCHLGVPEYSGLWQAFPDESGNFGKTIKPGDTIKASVVYQGSSEFQLNLADTTQGWTATTTQTVSGATRDSAAVALQAPTYDPNDEVPLTDFGTLHANDSLVDGAPIGSFSPLRLYVDELETPLDSVSPLSGREKFSVTFLLPRPVPVLSDGKAVALSPVREEVTWQQTLESWEKFKIVGPGAINGHVGWVPPGTTTAYYGGLEAHHGYTVTYTPYTAENGSPIAGAKPGSVYFVS